MFPSRFRDISYLAPFYKVMHKIAIIDLGTNTFHLFIAAVEEKVLHTLYKEKIAVKIGHNGISDGRIAPDAFKRALHTLGVFRTVIDQFEVTDIRGVATSAIRNASNGKELLSQIKSSVGIDIEMISGKREAELIYYGVRAAGALMNTPQLMMDIGGGSVEFIIGDQQRIYWSHSFEIGAQRLLDKFHDVDPMPTHSIQSMNSWLEIELKELKAAQIKYKPQGFIGCSGTFDTLKDIYLSDQQIRKEINTKCFEIPISAYMKIHAELIQKDRSARLSIPGMLSMRVDMIVVASCLINFVLDQTEMKTIVACEFALKEGLLFYDHQNSSITDL